MDEHDRERLLAFIEATRVDLDFVFSAAERYLDPGLFKLLIAAWNEVQQKDEFAQVRQRVETQEYDRRLEDAGLSGAGLEFKLKGVELARNQGRASKRRGRRGALRRWLSWIDVPLASLLAAVGAGEAIKELKEGVETALESPPSLGGLSRIWHRFRS